MHSVYDGIARRGDIQITHVPEDCAPITFRDFYHKAYEEAKWNFIADKIIAGYLILLAVIGSMIAILLHERKKCMT